MLGCYLVVSLFRFCLGNLMVRFHECNSLSYIEDPISQRTSSPLALKNLSTFSFVLFRVYPPNLRKLYFLSFQNVLFQLSSGTYLFYSFVVLILRFLLELLR